MQPHAPAVEPVSFQSEGLRINGVLHLPAVESAPVVIGSHGLFSDGNSPKQIALAQKCTQIGLAYFRFDHRGCGKSDGDFQAVTSLAGRVADLSDAVTTVQAHPAVGSRIGLFGSSMGGATALCLASQGVPIQAMVTVAAPLRSAPILAAARKTGDLRGLPLSFYENNLYFDISNDLEQISNLLIFHGDADETVPVSDAHELFAKTARPKKRIIHQHGDHAMSDTRHQAVFMHSAVAWFQDFLG